MNDTESMMQIANGEIRIQPIRYGIIGCNFMCLVSLQEQPDDFWERFEDMVGGDLDFFNAKEFLLDKGNWSKYNFAFSYGSSAASALNEAMDKAEIHFKEG